jgi:hypothetical protein
MNSVPHWFCLMSAVSMMASVKRVQQVDCTTTQNNHTKMYSHPDASGCNRRIGFSNNDICEHEREFFGLFDFSSEPASTKAESSSSPLKSIQGAASVLFGGFWSALDSAIAILNEDMNMEDSAAEMIGSNDDAGNDGDMSMDRMSESTESCSEVDIDTLKALPATVVNPSKATDNRTAIESLSGMSHQILRFNR